MAGKRRHIEAAEKALGLDPIGPETRAEAELRQRWERRFAALGLAVPPAQPPEDMWYRILRGLDDAENAKVLRKAKTSRNLWRGAALAATALAAGLAYFAFAPVLETPGTEPAPRYVAVASAIDGKGAVIVEIDLASNSLLVRPVGVTIGDDQDLQLWRIEPGGTPQSVGLVDTDETNRFDVSANPGDRFAISIEATGGVERAEDHGPVGYIGELVEVPE